jgi:hypothetical protein
MALYVTEAEIKNTIGPQAFRAIFDDEGDGVINQAAVELIRKRASRRVDGCMAKLLGVPFTMPDPPYELGCEAALEYAVGMTYLRDPVYAKRYGEKNKVDEFERAEKLCKELADNILRMPDAPTPANVTTDVAYGTSDEHPDGVGGGIFRGGFGDY